MSWDLDEELGFPAKLPADAFLLAQQLQDVSLVRRVHFFEEIDSTSRWLMRRLQETSTTAVIDGTLVVANFQTSGKGRHDRQWFAPPHKALLMSLGLVGAPLREALEKQQVELGHYLAMTVTLAVAEALRLTTGLPVAIKYPNDMMLNGRKCGGILLERALCFPDTFIVGIGINVNQDEGDLPPTTHIPPISLKIVARREWDRWQLCRAILVCFERWWKRPDVQAATQKMNEWCLTIGRRVKVTSPGRKVEGVALGISERGGLLIREDSGQTVELFGGDILELDTAPMDQSESM